MSADAVLDLLAAYVAVGVMMPDDARATYAAWEAGDPATRDRDLLAVVGTDDLAAALLLLGALLAGPRIFAALRSALTPSLAERALAFAAAAAQPPAEVARRAEAVAERARVAVVNAMMTPPSGDGRAGSPDVVRAVLSEAARAAAAPEIVAVNRAVDVLTGSAPPVLRDRLARELLDVFDAEADRRTALLFAAPDDTAADRRSRGDLRRWQVGMRQAVTEDLATLARLGAGRALTPAEEAELARVAVSQGRYLDGFAADVARQRAGLRRPGEPTITERGAAARLKMYGGEPLAAFYRLATADLGEGWVVDYRARDDGGTCTPCLSAERGGPYLPGSAPLPGAVCAGRGHCRCALEPRLDPAAYARLTGAARRQAA